MKTIGLIGGVSWESSAEYYRLINRQVNARLGGLHSARILMYSFDFEDIVHFQHAGDFQRAGALLETVAQALIKAGAQCIVICSNTTNATAEALEKTLPVPVLHIADATGQAINRAKLNCVGCWAPWPRWNTIISRIA